MPISGAWTYTLDGTDATITDYDTGIGGFTPTIPTTLDTNDVIAIAASAMASKSLTSVTITHAINLAANALALNTGMTVTLSADVTVVGVASSTSPFENCAIGTGLTISEGVTEIPDYLFTDAGLSGTITLPSTLTSIGVYSFKGNNIASIEFDHVMHVRYSAFETNVGISVTVSADITSDAGNSNGPFEACAIGSGSNVTIAEGVTSLPVALFAESGLTSMPTIPSTLTTLAHSLFYNCDITAITIPSQVTLIDNYCFYSNLLTALVLPSALTSIGVYSFTSNSIASIEFNHVMFVGYSAFENNVGISVTVNANITSDAGYSNGPFESCAIGSGTNVTISEGVTSLPAALFAESGLTSMPTIPSTLTTLAGTLFYNCDITAITIPSQVTLIGDTCFYSNLLTALVLPSTLISLGTNAFENNAIDEIVIDNPIFIGYRAFKNNGTMSVTLATSGLTSNSSGNVGPFEDSILGSNLTIAEGVTSIPNSLFVNSGITTITFPSTLTTLNDSCFKANSITALVLPSTLISLGISAFQDNAIDEIVIDNTIFIGYRAFKNNGTMSVTLATNGLTSNALSNVGPFEDSILGSNLTIAEGVTSIPNSFFANSGITTITFPSTLTTLGTDVLSTNLTLDAVTFLAQETVTFGAGVLNACTPSPKGTIYGDDISVETWAAGYSTYYDYAAVPPSPWTYTLDGTDATITNFETGVSPKFGSACGVFDGTGDYLSLADSGDFDFGSGDFTIECWIRFNTSPSSYVCPWSQRISSSSQLATMILLQDSGGDKDIYFQYHNGALVQFTKSQAGNWTPNTWYHVAVVRDSSLLRFFIDGVEIATEAITGTITDSTAIPTIGMASEGTQYPLNGYLDEIRISKGIARWTSGFTPPTSAYTSDANTQLLLHCDGAIGSTTFTDDGNTGHTVTAQADAKLTAILGGFNPIIPVTLDGNDVVGIASYAMDYKSLTSVTINHAINLSANAIAFNTGMAVTLSADVTTIGVASTTSPFEACAIGTGLTISEGVTEIPKYLFAVAGVSSITLPSTLTTMSSYSFQFNNIASIEFDHVMFVGLNSFAGNGAISVTVSANITSDAASGSGIFENCVIGSGTNVTISEGVTSLPTALFADSGLTSMPTIPSTLTTLTVSLFQYCNITAITIPSHVTYIGLECFSSNLLTALVLPSTLTHIDTRSFYLNSIASITFNHVMFVGSSAFKNNVGISVTVNANITSNSSTSNGIFENCVIGSGTNVTISEGVTSLPTALFADSGLTSMPTIPSTLTTLAWGLFWNCNITAITIPSHVTYIGIECFYSNLLTALVLPSTLTSIDTRSFYLNSIASITFNHVMFVGSSAFRSNGAISVTVNANITSNAGTSSGVFEGCVIGSGSNVTISEGVTSLPTALFAESGLTSMPTIPSTLTTLAWGLFWDCNITAITIPSHVTYIDIECFYSNLLTALVLPSTVTYIGTRSFYLNSIASITFNHVMFVGSSAFRSNGAISVTVNANITSNAASSSGVFEACTVGSNATISEGVTSLPIALFAESGVTSITFPTSMVTIGSYCLYNNDDLTSVTFLAQETVTFGTSVLGASTPSPKGIIYGKDVSVETWAAGYSTYYDYAAVATSRLKYWNGSAWEIKLLKYKNGPTWEEKPLKYWTGSEWSV